MFQLVDPVAKAARTSMSTEPAHATILINQVEIRKLKANSAKPELVPGRRHKKLARSLRPYGDRYLSSERITSTRLERKSA